MTEEERDAKIKEIMFHKPPYPDPVKLINEVHAAFTASQKLAAKSTGVDPVGSPSPGKTTIKQPGAGPMLPGRR